MGADPYDEEAFIVGLGFHYRMGAVKAGPESVE
jgi:hypothetical protein